MEGYHYEVDFSSLDRVVDEWLADAANDDEVSLAEFHLMQERVRMQLGTIKMAIGMLLKGLD